MKFTTIIKKDINNYHYNLYRNKRLNILKNELTGAEGGHTMMLKVNEMVIHLCKYINKLK